MPVYVSLDLETSGVDPVKDAIIEIGAVKFNEDGVIEEFATLVNPDRPLDPHIRDLTGISDEDLAAAPDLRQVKAALEAFLHDVPLVGHNVTGFDALFLANNGIRFGSPILDTYELATTFLPANGEYSLRALAQRFGIENPRPHRALPDAVTTMDVFRGLLKHVSGLPSSVLSGAERWLERSDWAGREFLRAALAGRPTTAYAPNVIRQPEPLVTGKERQPVDRETLLAVFRAAVNKQVISGFEERPEQSQMAEAVGAAFNEGKRLLVEAGTGTGKSLAYLVPAALHALANGSRVVVSTNTLNLQHQLLEKDIPALAEMLKAAGIPGELTVAALKGRRNYLCLRRFNTFEPGERLMSEEARLLARITIWAAETETGDRSELRLNSRAQSIWDRLNAEGARCTTDNCPFVADGRCFPQRARRRAEAAHILVVNHALLLSDLAIGGYLLPHYDDLIIDEAHHLEEEATRQLGFHAGEREIAEALDSAQRLAVELRAEMRRGSFALSPAAHLQGQATALTQALDRCRTNLQRLGALASAFLRQQAGPGSDFDSRLLVTAGVRAQPDWSDIEIAWDNLDLTIVEVAGLLRRLQDELRPGAPAFALTNRDSLAGETEELLQRLTDLREGLTMAMEQEEKQRVVWLEQDRERQAVSFAWAPLEVASALNEKLYAGRNAVILTGATIQTGPPVGFNFIRRQLGLEDAEELALGSPFDFRQAAIVLASTDMPEPTWADYLETMSRCLSELATASGGRGLCLFTSNSALNAVHGMTKPLLAEHGIGVYGQGIDGAPQDLVRILRRNPASLILGSASFWEGVDIVGDALSLLVVARLPFSVPSEPLFVARSELLEDPFNQLALPQAALRLRQGFGRLIRSRTDRGVMAILDSRISSRSYGKTLLQALPDCEVRHLRTRDLAAQAARWLQGSA